MGGLKWTIAGFDEEWLESKIPEYTKLVGTQRMKNEVQRAWVASTIEAYHDRFPGHSDTWSLSKVGRGGSPAERKEKIKDVRFFSPHICASKKIHPAFYQLVL